MPVVQQLFLIDILQLVLFVRIEFVPIFVVQIVGMNNVVTKMIILYIDRVIAPALFRVIDMEDEESAAWNSRIPSLALTVLQKQILGVGMVDDVRCTVV